MNNTYKYNAVNSYAPQNVNSMSSQSPGRYSSDSPYSIYTPNTALGQGYNPSIGSKLNISTPSGTYQPQSRNQEGISPLRNATTGDRIKEKSKNAGFSQKVDEVNTGNLEYRPIDYNTNQNNTLLSQYATNSTANNLLPNNSNQTQMTVQTPVAIQTPNNNTNIMPETDIQLQQPVSKILNITYPTVFQSPKEYLMYLDKRIQELEAKYCNNNTNNAPLLNTTQSKNRETSSNFPNTNMKSNYFPSTSQQGMQSNYLNNPKYNGSNLGNNNNIVFGVPNASAPPINIQNNSIFSKPNPYSTSTKMAAGEQNNLKLEPITIKSDYGAIKAAKTFADDPNSEYNQLIKRLKASGQRFKDTQFPPDYRSLVAGKELSEIAWDARSLIWCRPDEFYGKGSYNIYQGGISMDDIKQGELGDCYFLSTLAALAEFPHRIEKLFVSKQVNDQGCYAVRICDMGIWQEVILDDYFPCYPDDHTLTFAKGNGNELWVILLEKAWAKLYGSYAKIEAGLTREALHDLTGAPTKYYNASDMKNQPEQKEKLWHEILHGEQHDFVMTCGSYGNDDSEQKNGIFFGHAYSLLSAYEINTPRGKLRLLKIRNPHSHGEWTGNWSDHSPLWTLDIKSQVGFVDQDDGTFFMSWEDFFEYYEDVEICKVHDDFHYSHLRVPGVNHKNATFFKITIRKGGKHYVTVNQQSKRHHDDQENFEHSPIWLFLSKSDGKGGYEYIHGIYKADREVFTDCELTPGEYYVYVKASWFDQKRRDFVLSVYGPDDVEIIRINKSDCSDFIKKLFMHKARQCKKIQNYNSHGHPNCIKIMENLEEGYLYIYYHNRSNKALVEIVDFITLEGRKLVKPHRGRRYEIKVAPNEEKIVLLKEDYWAENIRHNMSVNTRFE